MGSEFKGGKECQEGDKRLPIAWTGGWVFDRTSRDLMAPSPSLQNSQLQKQPQYRRQRIMDILS